MDKINILLVDDHQIILDGVRMMIESEADINICGTTTDPAVGLAMAAEWNPDIIIVDISMPGLNGIAFTEQIHKNQPLIGIIVLSMHATEEYICSLLKAGATAYITKQGASREEILKAIRAVRAGEEYYSDEVQKVITRKYVSQAKKGVQFDVRPASLTNREKEILKLYADGYSNHEISEKLCISNRTVDAHKNNIMQKFNFKSTVDMVKFAIRTNLVDL